MVGLCGGNESWLIYLNENVFVMISHWLLWYPRTAFTNYWTFYRISSRPLITVGKCNRAWRCFRVPSGINFLFGKLVSCDRDQAGRSSVSAHVVCYSFVDVSHFILASRTPSIQALHTTDARRQLIYEYQLTAYDLQLNTRLLQNARTIINSNISFIQASPEDSWNSTVA